MRTGRRVLLRIEDHDRERSHEAFDAAIAEDLAWLGFEPDAGPVRQRGTPGPYEAALARLRADGLVYACDCSRTTFAAWAAVHRRPWAGPGCPGGCRDRSVADDGVRTLRVRLGGGDERWSDLLLGPAAGPVAPVGDLPIRDRQGNWTYGFSVVVDDLRQGMDLVVRGADLSEATPAQIRLARLLGRPEPATFAHHRLILKPSGAKLSKADGDTGVRDLRAAGLAPEQVVGMAAAAIGLLGAPRDLPAIEAMAVVPWPPRTG